MSDLAVIRRYECERCGSGMDSFARPGECADERCRGRMVVVEYVSRRDAERGRALVDRMFEYPRPSPEWEQALAELRVWSMSAWNQPGERS